MNVPVLNRSHTVALLLGTVLFVSAFTFVGTALGFLTQPAMSALKNYANPLLSTGVAILNLASVAIVLLALIRAKSVGDTRSSSVWARNASILSAARLVACVYLALIPVNLIVGEVRSFFQIQVGNFTQIDMLSGPGLAFLTLGLPVLGIVLVLVVGPGALEKASRSAVS